MLERFQLCRRRHRFRTANTQSPSGSVSFPIQFNSIQIQFCWGKLKEKRTCGVDFSVGSDAKEGLFASGQLDGPQGGQGVANCWRFDFGAFDASAQLAAVVVTPSVDLSAADGRPTLRPILRVTVFNPILFNSIQF